MKTKKRIKRLIKHMEAVIDHIAASRGLSYAVVVQELNRTRVYAFGSAEQAHAWVAEQKEHPDWDSVQSFTVERMERPSVMSPEGSTALPV